MLSETFNAFEFTFVFSSCNSVSISFNNAVVELSEDDVYEFEFVPVSDESNPKFPSEEISLAVKFERRSFSVVCVVSFLVVMVFVFVSVFVLPVVVVVESFAVAEVVVVVVVVLASAPGV